MKQEEIEYTVPIYRGCVDLRPIWLTERGYKFLKGTDAWMFCDEKELSEIMENAKLSQITIRSQVVKDGTPWELPDAKRQLHNWVGGRWKKVKWKKRIGFLELITNSGNPDSAMAIRSFLGDLDEIDFVYKKEELLAYKSKTEARVVYGRVVPMHDEPKWEYEINVERIIRTIGRIKSEQALRILTELLKKRWGYYRGVYFWAKIAGGYDMHESSYAEPIVMSWILSSIDREYLDTLSKEGSDIPEDIGRVLRKVLDKIPWYDMYSDYGPQREDVSCMIRSASDLLLYYNHEWNTLEEFLSKLVGSINDSRSLDTQAKEFLLSEIDHLKSV